MNRASLPESSRSDESRHEQEESRVQRQNPEPESTPEETPEPVFSEEAAQVAEERLLRNDQGPGSQAES